MQNLIPQDFDIDDPETWSVPFDFGIGANFRPLQWLIEHFWGAPPQAAPTAEREVPAADPPVTLPEDRGEAARIDAGRAPLAPRHRDTGEAGRRHPGPLLVASLRPY